MVTQEQRKTWARGSGWKVDSRRPVETLYPLPPDIATDTTATAGFSMMKEQVPSEYYVAMYDDEARQAGGRAAVEADSTPQATESCEALSAILGTKDGFYNKQQPRITSRYGVGATFVFQPAPRDDIRSD